MILEISDSIALIFFVIENVKLLLENASGIKALDDF